MLFVRIQNTNRGKDDPS